MARPKKDGLDYFPMDVYFFNDEKIEAISGEFGLKGEIVAIKLLCAVYRNGYYILWSELLKMKLLKSLQGVSVGLLDQIVARLVEWDFFDKTLFDSAGVLTSNGIQKRYFEAIKRRKGDEELPFLLQKVRFEGVNVDINPVPEGVNANIYPQSKGKERKVKEDVEEKTQKTATEASPSFQDSLPEGDWRAIKSPEEHAAEALPDTSFLSVAWQAGVKDKPVLEAWLEKFNEFLYMQSKTAKNRADYRTHFLNWMKKKPYPERNQMPADENQKAEGETPAGPLTRQQQIEANRKLMAEYDKKGY